jgi:hypothetical protein
VLERSDRKQQVLQAEEKNGNSHGSLPLPRVGPMMVNTIDKASNQTHWFPLEACTHSDEWSLLENADHDCSHAEWTN